MKKGLTEIVLVLDRSGSMESTRKDAEGGLRAFINKQKLVPGECRVTFYRFDSIIERLFENKPINVVEDKELALEPRGSTALLDAMNRAIDEVGDRLRAASEEDRPERIFFVTITDGEENASRTTYSELADKIKHQSEKYKWEFIFIGANQDAIATASRLNITPQYSLTYNQTRCGTVNAYNVLTQNLTASRTTGGTFAFTAEDREKAMED